MQQQIDYQQSLAVARAIQAQPKACWRNAAMALLTCLDAGRYVEGIAVWNGIPMEHGWVEVENSIVDPTWVVGHARDGRVVYHPMFCYTAADLLQHVGKRMPLYMDCPTRLKQVVLRLQEMVIDFASEGGGKI